MKMKQSHNIPLIPPRSRIKLNGLHYTGVQNQFIWWWKFQKMCSLPVIWWVIAKERVQKVNIHIELGIDLRPLNKIKTISVIQMHPIIYHIIKCNGQQNFTFWLIWWNLHVANYRFPDPFDQTNIMACF